MLKHIVVENFFDTPNLINSYVAGFIAADGNITLKNGIKNVNRLLINLSEKDEAHLEKIRNYLTSAPLRKSIEFREMNGYKFTSNKCSLQICNSKIVKSLDSNFNIGPKKTHTYKPPINLNNPEAFAFIIGLIDGDGTIGVYKQPTSQFYRLVVTILGTEELLILGEKNAV